MEKLSTKSAHKGGWIKSVTRLCIMSYRSSNLSAKKMWVKTSVLTWGSHPKRTQVPQGRLTSAWCMQHPADGKFNRPFGTWKSTARSPRTEVRGYSHRAPPGRVSYAAPFGSFGLLGPFSKGSQTHLNSLRKPTGNYRLLTVFYGYLRLGRAKKIRACVSLNSCPPRPPWPPWRPEDK